MGKQFPFSLFSIRAKKASEVIPSSFVSKRKTRDVMSTLTGVNGSMKVTSCRSFSRILTFLKAFVTQHLRATAEEEKKSLLAFKDQIY